MKIWDTVIFRDELDMLECRLYELQDTAIYRHVIVEATVDHQGNSKPLVFPEHRDRFAAWLDRIVYVAVDDLPSLAVSQNPWARENAQRERTGRGLGGASPDDVVLHSDVDEIPSPAAVKAFEGIEGPHKLSMRCAVFAVDWVLPWPWYAVSATRVGQVAGFNQLRMGAWPLLSLAECPGWHLSWMGGPESIRRKRAAYCHLEMNAEIDQGIAQSKYYERGLFWGHGQGETQLLAADVDESWPRWVYERKCPESWFRPRG